MTESEKIYNKLREQYTDEEIVDFVMIPEEMGEKEEQAARAEFVKLRMKRRQEMSQKDKLLSGLLTIKYQIKAYVRSSGYQADKTLGSFLRKYIEVIGRKQKDLAEEIDIHPSRLNRILNGKEKIGKSIAYRLENHSGDLIPALFWWKLMQKEVEEELMTEEAERGIERQHVKNIVYQA